MLLLFCNCRGRLGLAELFFGTWCFARQDDDRDKGDRREDIVVIS